MEQRFLDPSVLAGLAGLDLVAKTVVDGFVSGLHRSPTFGSARSLLNIAPTRPGTICAMSTGTFSPVPNVAT